MIVYIITLISMYRIVQTFVSNQWKQLSNIKAEEMSKDIRVCVVGVTYTSYYGDEARNYTGYRELINDALLVYMYTVCCNILL